MWYYRCDRCHQTETSFRLLWVCQKPHRRGQLRIERSAMLAPRGDNDVILATGSVWDRAMTDTMTNRALEMAFAKIKELSGGSVERADFTSTLRRRDHYGKTATAEWAARVFDDLTEERTLRKVEYMAEVSIDMAHLPGTAKGRLEFKGPDMPHVGWELNRKIWSYAPDDSEKVVRKDEAVVGHIILDDVPVFRPIEKDERNARDEVVNKKELKTVDKRMPRGAKMGHGA
jgi:hypothetical protein